LQVYRGKHYQTDSGLNLLILGTRNYPIVIGSGVAVMVFALLAGAAVTGVLRMGPSRQDESIAPVEKTAAAAAARRSQCPTCGVISALEAVQGESGGLAGYRVTVRMDDGRERSLALGSKPGYGVGARVRVVNGNKLERG
jgi:hypothetical protein